MRIFSIVLGALMLTNVPAAAQTTNVAAASQCSSAIAVMNLNACATQGNELPPLTLWPPVAQPCFSFAGDQGATTLTACGGYDVLTILSELVFNEKPAGVTALSQQGAATQLGATQTGGTQTSSSQSDTPASSTAASPMASQSPLPVVGGSGRSSSGSSGMNLAPAPANPTPDPLGTP